jgi:hypothetical protein
MTEVNQVDAAVRRHLGPLGRFKRVTHATEAGWPDWHWAMRGRSGWLEDKLIPPSRRCPGAFTLDQITWGEEEVRAGGSWHLLGLEPRTRTWLLVTVGHARIWFDGGPLNAEVEETGVFPTKAIALALAPRRV